MRFKYGDKVKVIKGFWEGCVGFILNELPSSSLFVGNNKFYVSFIDLIDPTDGRPYPSTSYIYAEWLEKV